jgi:hypothetical protein
MKKQRFRAVLQVLAALAVLVPLASGESKADWVNIGLNHSFEGTAAWPSGKWIAYDCSHTSTQGIWSKTTSKAYVGTTSVHPRGGTTPYNYNTCTWMRFGPFGVNAGATDARMVFNYWLDSEVGYDFFRWEYNCDGVAGEWTGQAVSGNVGIWKAKIFSLKPCIGKTQVYVQFFFQSDQSVNYQGVWLDNVRFQQFFP